ncbi:hypothetical protein T01_3767, partial [Trichinella spiralis]
MPSNHVLRERKEIIEHLKILYLPITFGVSEKRLRGQILDELRRDTLPRYCNIKSCNSKHQIHRKRWLLKNKDNKHVNGKKNENMSCNNTKSGSSECTVILSVMNCCMLSGRCSGPPALNIAGAFPFVSVVFRSIHFFICFCSASRPLVEAPLLTLLYSSNGTFIHFFLCYRCRSLVSVDSGGMFSHIIQQKLRDLQ